MTKPHKAILVLLGLLGIAFAGRAQSAAELIQHADTLLAGKDPNGAMELCNQALAMGPSAAAYAARARVWYYQGKYDKFLQDVDEALTLDSLHGMANYQRAIYAFRGGDNDATVLYASRALADSLGAEPREQALIMRGEAYAALGQATRAIEDLQEGLKGNALELDAMKTLARLLDQVGRTEESLAVLERLCTLAPQDIANWSNRGFELNKLERYGEALAMLDNALAIDKDEPVVLSNKAYALLKLNRHAEAMTAVERSLKADRANPYALRTRALLYLAKGKQEKACNDLTLAKAIGGAPDVDALVKRHCAGLPQKN